MSLVALFLAAAGLVAFTGLFAVVKFFDISHIAGSIGGSTYQHTKGGTIKRAKPVPTNPNTPRQQETRAVLGTQSAAWSSVLNQTQRDAWDAFAEISPVVGKLGANIYLTGHQWFIKVNARLSDADLTVLGMPPVAGAPPSIVGLDVTSVTSSSCSVAFTTALEAGNVLVLWATPPKKVGSSPNFDQAYLVGYSAADAATPIAFTLPWTLQNDHEIHFFAFQMSAEGILSAAEMDSYIEA